MAYKQAQNRKKRLLKTYNETKYNYGSGVYYDKSSGRYIKYTASNTPGYAKSLRRLSNKKVRKNLNIGNFANYKKVYDYKWELF